MFHILFSETPLWTAPPESAHQVARCLRHPSLPADNIPDRINPCPSSGSRWVRSFAFVMRFEPQDPTTWFEGARASTVGAFHERNATLQKTREFNGNHPRKRAFGGFGGLLLVRL